MLKKAFAAFLATGVFMLQASLTIFAAESDFTSANNPVTVTKAADGAYTVTVSNPYFAGETITAAVIREGEDPSVLKTDPSKVLYVNEATADGEGSATFQFFPREKVPFYVAVGSSRPMSYTEGGATTSYIKASVKTYTVTVSSGANGTVIPGGTTTVEENGSFTLTATPNQGYELDKILVNGADTPANNEGKVTITVTRDTVIEVSFKAAAALPPEITLPAEVAFQSADKTQSITFG
ncbi:hypothetical protein [Acetivibrio sp. MSJd-27]|uniref:InlB B-repeat-containing protein n=1 Tax=Acetivibrio sp. MSJd-27 TaxID=2841523 RepID=UPI001C1074F5|nr:hypothetical protein [Acetivibrio sp. MSJd-27]MBU5449488.1 hypothetical protein [Acetivibrio sp. MSJd-27]